MRFFLSGAGGGSGGGQGSGRDGPTTKSATEAAKEPAVRTKTVSENRLLEVITPLNVIVGFSSMLADLGHDLTPELRHRYATHVRDAADTLQQMMSALVHRLEGKGLDLSEDWVSSGTFRVAEEAKEQEDPRVVITPTPPEVDDGQPRPRVFLVDSDDASRELLSEYLAGRGYDLTLVGSGEEAMHEAERRPPDLVLIDPLMPREDGFHIARLLKASNPNGYVPLVFVTALVDDDSRMRALDAGAEQMVKKPVNRHELRARVKNLLQLRAHQEELAAQNVQLKALQRFKDETTAMLVHDLKSPLSAMMMNLDFALDDLPSETTTGDARTALAESRAAGAKLFRMIANLLDIARSDDGRLAPRRCPLEIPAVFQRVIEEHTAEAQARKVTLESKISLDGHIDADPDILGRVLANLVENGLRYTHAGGKIVLAAAREGPESIILTVTNDGRPISSDLRAFIFEKYGQGVGSQAMNRGLGLYFCRVAVEAHGGKISLSDGDAGSTSFRIELPQSVHD
jgi:signal transduction histidine kinase